MRVLKGILKESRDYYKQSEREILERLVHLPKGSIKKRQLNKQFYYYLQFRKGPKIVHKYLGKEKPRELLEKLKERRHLEEEFKKVRHSLRLLRKLKRKKRKK